MNDKIQELLNELNYIAMSYCKYDYGLPMTDDVTREMMIAYVQEWINNNKESICAGVVAVIAK